MNRRLICSSAAVLLLLLGACSSEDEQASSHSFRVIEEDGITVAETLGGPRYRGEIFDYVPVMTIEQGDTEETMLFNPTTFIADSDGWFYVNDSGNGDIVVFDPEGRFHKRIGRRGAGPGEFQRAQFLCTVEDMLYIFDYSQWRTTRFRRSGEVVDMVSLQRIPGAPRVTALIPLPGADRLLLSTGDDSPSLPGGSTGEGNSWCNVLRMTADGDTVWSWSSEPIKTSYPMPITIGGNTFSVFMPFPYAVFAQAYYVPDFGVVAMASVTPQLEILNLDGQLHRRFRIDLGDLSVTEEDRQAVIDLMDKMIEDAPQDENLEVMEAQRKGMQFSEMKAPWSSLRYDDRGYMYLTPQ
ncbi:6-bladed beta-propeller, partial [Gemmatimonadota bacterium]